jgi:hypothetical protein
VLIEPEVVADAADPEGGVLRVRFPDGAGCETFEIPLWPSPETLARWKLCVLPRPPLSLHD